MNKMQVRTCLRRAMTSSEVMRKNVAELVVNKGWEILGYESFIQMWENELDFKTPREIKVMAVQFAISGKPRITSVEVAKMIGLPVSYSSSGSLQSSNAALIIKSLRDGQDPKDVRIHSGHQYGKNEELVRFTLKEIAHLEGTPIAEIYRQAVAEFLHKKRAKKAAW